MESRSFLASLFFNTFAVDWQISPSLPLQQTLLPTRVKVSQLLLTVEPSDAKCLQDTEQDQWDSAAGVVVKELEHIESSLQPTTSRAQSLVDTDTHTPGPYLSSRRKWFPCRYHTHLSDQEETNYKAQERDGQQEHFASMASEKVGRV